MVPDFTISTSTATISHITSNGTTIDVGALSCPVLALTLYNVVKPDLSPYFLFPSSPPPPPLFFQVLLNEHNASIHAIATHPSEPRLLVGSYSCRLKLWDYEQR